MNSGIICKTAYLALALGAAMLHAPTASASDTKYFNAASVCAPYTSSAPDYAQLRFRAEGIINDSDTSKFVICNLPRDSEAQWDAGAVIPHAFFRRTTAGTPAITNNQCTLTVGFNFSEPLQSKTYSAVPLSATYGYVMMTDNPTGDSLSYGTVVCRIAPGSLMDLFAIVEENATETPTP